MGKTEKTQLDEPGGDGLRCLRAVSHTFASFQDEAALDRAERDKTGLAVLDDCRVLADQPESQARLLSLLWNMPKKTRVVLLSRVPTPDWLLPFQISGHSPGAFPRPFIPKNLPLVQRMTCESADFGI